LESDTKVSDDKKVTFNLNGVELTQGPAPKKNLLKDYQILWAGILVAALIGAHAWWVRAMSVNVTPTEVQVKIVPVPTPEKTPWENRLVKEYTKKK
jgi:hypothetical protein